MRTVQLQRLCEVE